ncbi:hypothetical protein [Glutamicibacter arilaitensis]|uniref:hypothetical protein n=1 Tax=Glutamicibacter arilaitensis TaxID=256701 RepID=UPI003FD3BE32
MIINWNSKNEYGFSEITVIPGVYDAYPPIESLLMSASPRSISEDKIAIAATLAFGEFLSGPIAFPFAVSPMVAEAMMDYLRPLSVYIEKIDFNPKAIHSGPNTFCASNYEQYSTQECRVMEFKQPLIENSFGSNFLDNILTVPTNARHLSSNSDEEDLTESFTDQELAALVLLSEDYGVGTISLGREVSSELVSLLKSCGISLSR